MTGLREKLQIRLLRVQLLIAEPGVLRRRFRNAHAETFGENVEIVDREGSAGVLRRVKDAMTQDSVLADRCFQIISEIPPLLTVLSSGLARIDGILADA